MATARRVASLPAERRDFDQVKSNNFFAELKRRNVYKVAVAYAVVGWLECKSRRRPFRFSKFRIGQCDCS